MRRPGWTFAIVSIALFMVVLDNLVVTTALPSIRADPGATIQSLEWTVNAYTLSYAVLLLTGAALGDRFGRRRMFITGLALFTAASAAAALAPTTEALIAARAIQGLGAASTTMTFAIIRYLFGEVDRRRRDCRQCGHRGRAQRRRRAARVRQLAADLYSGRGGCHPAVGRAAWIR